ncbi:DEAD/DEAH box helicase [Microbaculum sp. FT89]|uniref:DEAD/DEAH box helicase n=1 Tax=Microbaculum sp. FT89 TaxID=3447298 RepID=UPI003F53E0A4
MNTFSELNLSASVLRALSDAGHEMPTPIQAQAIPHLLNGRDLIGIAQTGTGKTAAFALPILDRLERRHQTHKGERPAPKSCRVLILSPTRELSGQIVDSFRSYGRHLPLKVELVIGGVPMNRQIRALQPGVDVLVATPGRLLDLVEQRALRLDKVEVLVLDEADQMLDMGFIHAIRATVKFLPAERQTLLFSATMPQTIADLSRQFLRDPVRVSVTPVAKTADKIDQTVIHVNRADKSNRLASVLSDPAIDRALVFTRTKHGADKVVRHLAKTGISAAAIHGNKSQNQRERTLAAFRSGNVRALIATDIAARGLDIPGVSHVVNYDLPNIPESYVHRIGRTARAGADGIAVSFCDAEERPFLRDIERLIRMSIPVDGAAPRPVVASAPVAGGTPDRTEADADKPHRNGRKRRRPGRGSRSPERQGQERQGQERQGQGQRDQARKDQGQENSRARPAEAQASNRANRHAPANAASGSGQDLAGMSFLKRKTGDRRSAAATVKH